MARPPADVMDIDKQFKLMVSATNSVTGILWMAYCCLECGCLVAENHGATACRRQHMLAGCNPNRHPPLTVTDE